MRDLCRPAAAAALLLLGVKSSAYLVEAPTARYVMSSSGDATVCVSSWDHKTGKEH